MNDLSDSEFQEMLDQYLQSIVVPLEKGAPFLLCPIGLVGSGKTTVVKPLAEKLGLVRVSHDEIRKLLKEQGYNYRRTEELTYAVMQKFLTDGFGVAIDADCVRADVQERIHALAEQYHLSTLWIHINPPEQFIIDKLTHYDHSWLFKDADEAIKNYQARKPLHENLATDFIYTFDPSRSDLAQQIDEATVLIRQKLAV